MKLHDLIRPLRRQDLVVSTPPENPEVVAWRSIPAR